MYKWHANHHMSQIKWPFYILLVSGYIGLSLFDTETFKISFWMKHFQAATLKRTVVVSNRSIVRRLDHGKLPKKLRTCEYATAKVYVKDGKKRFCGTRFLKRTQYQACICKLFWVCGLM